MKQTATIVAFGIIQMIILTIFGLYFYRLKHTLPKEVPVPIAPQSQSLSFDQ